MASCQKILLGRQPSWIYANEIGDLHMRSELLLLVKIKIFTVTNKKIACKTVRVFVSGCVEIVQLTRNGTRW